MNNIPFDISRYNGIVLIDFCGTIIPFQSVTPFVKYTAEKYHKNRAFTLWVEKILFRTHLMGKINRINDSICVDKALEIYALKGLTKEQIMQSAKEFYEGRIKPAINSDVIQTIKEYKSKRYFLCVVSAAYDSYLSYFCKEYEIDMLLCSEFKYEKDIFVGKLKGKDCIEKEKVFRILLEINEKIFLNDNIDTVAISDSVTDLPIFELCKKRVVVLDERKSIAPPDWASRIADEIIWHK